MTVEKAADLLKRWKSDEAQMPGLTPDGSSYLREWKDGWRCYHCGILFRTPGAAEEHFGKKPDGVPKCHSIATQPEARWNEKVAQIYKPKSCRTCQSPFREGGICTFCGDQSPHCPKERTP